MYRNIHYIGSLLLVLPTITHAAEIPEPVKQLLGKIFTQILNPLIALMFAVATVYFMYGVYQFMWDPDNEEAREKGRKAMFWGIIGLFIMTSVFGIMKFLISTFGADPAVLDYV